MRLFVAIPLPAAIRDAVGRSADAIRSEAASVVPASAFKWVRPENYHVTLKFLGDVGESQVAHVVDACRAAAGAVPSLTLTAGPILLHPHQGSVRLVVAELTGDVRASVTLATRLEEALLPLGFPRERRAFWPHVTIARTRSPLRLNVAERARWKEMAEASRIASAAFSVDSIELIESDLRPGGPVYTVVETLRLET